jgi:hypothetical protein
VDWPSAAGVDIARGVRPALATTELQLQRIEAAERDLAALEQRIQQKLEPYAAQLASLDEKPGVDWTLAAVIIAELGVDMSVLGSVSQLASWARVLSR